MACRPQPPNMIILFIIDGLRVEESAELSFLMPTFSRACSDDAFDAPFWLLSAFNILKIRVLGNPRLDKKIFYFTYQFCVSYRFELVLPLMPIIGSGEEYVARPRVGAFARELLQVLTELAIIRRVHGCECLGGDYAGRYAFDVSAGCSAEVQLEAAGIGMAFEQKRQRLQAY